MPCGHIRFERRLLSESLDEEAEYLDSKKQPLRAAWYRSQASKVRRTGQDRLVGTDGIGFMCGEGVEVCRCGSVADYLCDAPTGNGTTCDIPVCEDCRLNIGPDMDLCRIHRALAESAKA